MNALGWLYGVPIANSRPEYIYLIHRARGPYWENIDPRSWQYGPSAARSVQQRPRADILPVRSRASLVNKRVIPCNDRTGEVDKLFIIWPFSVILKRSTIRAPEVIFHVGLGAQYLEVIRSRVHRTETNLAHSFFDNETIFVFITSRSRENLTT